MMALRCSLDELIGFEHRQEGEETTPQLNHTAVDVGKFFESLNEQDTLNKLLRLAVET
ncbi:MAG: hypothetical protein ABII79_05510 [bacterium]